MPLRRAEAAAANFTSILIVPHALGLLLPVIPTGGGLAVRFRNPEPPKNRRGRFLTGTNNSCKKSTLGCVPRAPGACATKKAQDQQEKVWISSYTSMQTQRYGYRHADGRNWRRLRRRRAVAAVVGARSRLRPLVYGAAGASAAVDAGRCVYRTQAHAASTSESF